ncbi:hypothetical protein WT60_22210 [Burkholderia sp. MSMB617WGS]|nr:hypothetical protein WS78_20405 [Burkholderia savannae]AOK49623.1 hypothetical protein WT60_22210 [Burkholderia sp. MSMB617WGS]KVG48703.1 hypothetical protein WS77_02945 [Burkholderia sp. MSMB0265]KVG86159.1 hypothetical protein WS81_29610 [Burkholderia sp. MSMB2040]KVG90442.1 hypothetical protein WS82_17080 [Burkholderia sp. MSMB2041]KVH00096.1 hypothetical protein WS83_22850 [Burkholderia sp. MSMB2042]
MRADAPAESDRRLSIVDCRFRSFLRNPAASKRAAASCMPAHDASDQRVRDGSRPDSSRRI